MNILSSQELKQAEIFLSKIPTHPKFKLKLPSQKQLQKMTAFSGTVFPPASQAAQQQLQKLLTLSDNMRSLRQTQTNSVFHVITFTFINLLYQEKFNASNETNNQYILQIIRCTLFSNDIEFKMIRNVDFAVENNQLKIIVLNFLSFMEQQSRTIKTNRIKCAQWIFEQNPILLTTFTLFFRLILFKMGIPEAQDYRKPVKTQEAITNIIQFFDVHYRNLGELILFDQDGLFLSIYDNEIVLGEYYENEREKHNQKQQLEIKTEVQANMIESVLMNVAEKSSMVSQKKKGIVASDAKMFHFMLQSNSQDNETPIVHKEKEVQLQTPHFKESCPDNFQFLRKKKLPEFKREEVRSEFQKLMMDSSSDEIANPMNEVKMINQSLPTKNTSKIDETKIGQAPRLTSGKQPIKNYVSHANFRKTTEEKEKYTQMFKEASKKELAGSFYSGQTHCVSTHSNNKERSSDQWTEITNCTCRKARLSRNLIASKVLDINFVPQNNQRRLTYLSNITSPKFSNNYKPSYEQRQYQNSYKNGVNELKKPQKGVFAYKKPAFLNNLKKIKLPTQEQQSKSLVNQVLKNQQTIQKQKSQKYFSPGREVEGISRISAKSTPKLYENISNNTLFELGGNEQKSFKTDNISSICSGSKPWKSNSNLVHKITQYSQVNKIKFSEIARVNPEAKTSTNFNREINSPRAIKQKISPCKAINNGISGSKEVTHTSKM